MTDIDRQSPVKKNNSINCFIPFQQFIEGYALPERFTFPFYYEPHALSRLAAAELQEYINGQTVWLHDFGLENDNAGIGKMFGVLVVQNQQQELGYLAAFSGKLAGRNHHEGFVPPVFDILKDDGFFRKGEKIISEINSQIEKLESDADFISLQIQLKNESEKASEQLNQFKQELKKAKIARDQRRKQALDTLSSTDFDLLNMDLVRQSTGYQYHYKDLTKNWNSRLAAIQEQLNPFLEIINALKEERKNKSAQLQQQLFDHYAFLNQQGKKKSLCDIFQTSESIQPPAGAGECAAPKLLQYAFLHHLKPIAMAEFWWGKSPSSEIRKHGFFYPACKSKCEPILTHMLEGLEMDENPMLINPAIGKNLDIVYEDAYLLVINKPGDFFSVPGKNIHDSVLNRMKMLYPEATGPLIVHRLDMGTSGLMLIAKTKEIHQHLQSQFIKRRIKKRYAALLDGIVDTDEGFINLPLRVDLDDRPRQLVCYEYGKSAQTAWKVVQRFDNQTKIHFFPITGRTHQLRLHASHPKGLNMPIKGDDLYGRKADRLYLHAEFLEFVHPITNEVVHVEVSAPF